MASSLVTQQIPIKEFRETITRTVSRLYSTWPNHRKKSALSKSGLSVASSRSMMVMGAVCAQITWRITYTRSFWCKIRFLKTQLKLWPQDASKPNSNFYSLLNPSLTNMIEVAHAPSSFLWSNRRFLWQTLAIQERSCRLTRERNFSCSPEIIDLTKTMSPVGSLRMAALSTRHSLFNKPKAIIRARLCLGPIECYLVGFQSHGLLAILRPNTKSMEVVKA